MRAITLLYHDVVTSRRFSDSGFPGADADLYKLDRKLFIQHLDAVEEALTQAPVTVPQLVAGSAMKGVPVMLAFDDGGASAWRDIAPLLENKGWRGHFFISTDWIGKDGFLNAAQILDLHKRGHVIGSHSCSHPMRMSNLSQERILAEWADSLRKLADIVGQPLQSASVPAGYYSPLVGKMAAQAGVKALFHSEPVTSVGQVESCLLFGRYSVQSVTTPQLAADIAAGRLTPRARQYTYWQMKKILKRAGGEAWLQFRKRWFAKRALTED